MDMRSVQVRHPQPGDLVNNQLTIAGIGSGFEGVIGWRIRRDDIAVAEGSIQSGGGMGAWVSFAYSTGLSVGDAGPATLQVYGDNPGLPDEGPDPGFDVNTIPVILIPDMASFVIHVAQIGDTLTGIAEANPGANTNGIVQANPEVTDPDVIRAGQVLRVPLIE